MSATVTRPARPSSARRTQSTSGHSSGGSHSHIPRPATAGRTRSSPASSETAITKVPPALPLSEASHQETLQRLATVAFPGPQQFSMEKEGPSHLQTALTTLLTDVLNCNDNCVADSNKHFKSAGERVRKQLQQLVLSSLEDATSDEVSTTTRGMNALGTCAETLLRVVVDLCSDRAILQQATAASASTPRGAEVARNNEAERVAREVKFGTGAVALKFEDVTQHQPVAKSEVKMENATTMTGPWPQHKEGVKLMEALTNSRDKAQKDLSLVKTQLMTTKEELEAAKKDTAKVKKDLSMAKDVIMMGRLRLPAAPLPPPSSTSGAPNSDATAGPLTMSGVMKQAEQVLRPVMLMQITKDNGNVVCDAKNDVLEAYRAKHRQILQGEHPSLKPTTDLQQQFNGPFKSKCGHVNHSLVHADDKEDRGDEEIKKLTPRAGSGKDAKAAKEQEAAAQQQQIDSLAKAKAEWRNRQQEELDRLNNTPASAAPEVHEKKNELESHLTIHTLQEKIIASLEKEVSVLRKQRDENLKESQSQVNQMVAELEDAQSKMDETNAEWDSKQKELNRLRTLMRFSQLKRDSDKLQETYKRVDDLETKIRRYQAADCRDAVDRQDLRRLKMLEAHCKAAFTTAAENKIQLSGGQKVLQASTGNVMGPSLDGQREGLFSWLCAMVPTHLIGLHPHHAAGTHQQVSPTKANPEPSRKPGSVARPSTAKVVSGSRTAAQSSAGLDATQHSKLPAPPKLMGNHQPMIAKKKPTRLLDDDDFEVYDDQSATLSDRNPTSLNTTLDVEDDDDDEQSSVGPSTSSGQSSTKTSSPPFGAQQTPPSPQKEGTTSFATITQRMRDYLERKKMPEPLPINTQNSESAAGAKDRNKSGAGTARPSSGSVAQSQQRRRMNGSTPATVSGNGTGGQYNLTATRGINSKEQLLTGNGLASLKRPVRPNTAGALRSNSAAAAAQSGDSKSNTGGRGAPQRTGSASRGGPQAPKSFSFIGGRMIPIYK